MRIFLITYLIILHISYVGAQSVSNSITSNTSNTAITTNEGVSNTAITTNEGVSNTAITTNEGVSNTAITTNEGVSNTAITTNEGGSNTTITTNEGVSNTTITTNEGVSNTAITTVNNQNIRSIVSKARIIIDGKEFTIGQAIEHTLFNNLSIRESFINYIEADTESEAYKKKYATTFNINGNFSTVPTLPTTSLAQAITGNRTFNYNAGASVSKTFVSGTQVSLGLSNPYTVVSGTGLGTLVTPVPNLFKPTLYLTLQQDFLKNYFGVNDRRQNKANQLRLEMNREQMIDAISNILVQIITSYWQIIVVKENIKTIEEQLKNTQNLLEQSSRNYRSGLGEKYDVEQYSALISSVESKLQLSTFQLNEAIRNFLRQVNLSEGTHLESTSNLETELPFLDKDIFLQEAYSLRIDYKNAQKLLEYNKIIKDIAFNNLLPSITATAQLTLRGQDISYGTSLSQVYKFTNPDFNGGVQISYPLFDTDIKAKARNSVLQIEQSNIMLDRIKVEIKDKVYSNIEEIQLRYKLYENSKTISKKYSDYYQSLLFRMRQGRVTAVQLKLALDSLIAAKQAETEALVQYNVALLTLHLVKGDLFHAYDVDVLNILATLEKTIKK